MAASRTLDVLLILDIEICILTTKAFREKDISIVLIILIKITSNA